MRQKGFTLVELMVTISLIGIIAALVPSRIGRLVKERQGEKDVLTFWMEMRSLPAKVLKYDAPIIVSFDTTNSTYQVFADYDDDGEIDSGEAVRSALATSLEFGVPKTTGYTGSFKTTWVETGLVFQNDATITINKGLWGVLFLRNKELPDVGYQLYIPSNSKEIRLRKWTGATWYEM